MDEYSKFLEELKQKADVVDIVSTYSQVTRRGVNYFACCPYHIEKTPSFCIYPASNSYYCFGCHEQGDVIKLVEDMEKLDFNGAIEFLAKKYNMEVPQRSGSNMTAQLKKKRDRLHALMRDAAIHYYNNLMGPKGKAAREYLASRGLSQTTITNFGLGYSIDGEDLIRFLKEKGYTYAEMEEARVALKSSRGLYDPQSNRFVTPIMNSNKNVVAFGGRIIGAKKEGVGKYYNSMESFIFHKSNEIFGQHIVKTLRNIKDVILVEGYMDVISLYQAGIQNAVASMGTALTAEQARIIKRYAQKVYYMYDGDEAGQKGMLRGVDILHAEGLEVKVVVLEDGMDPDEYIKKFGPKAMKDKIYSTAIPMFEYKIRDVEKNFNLKSPEERGAFVKSAIECLKGITSKAEAEPLINYIQSKANVSKDALLELFTALQNGEEVKAPRIQLSIKNDKYTNALRFVLYAAYGGVDEVKVKDEFADCIQGEDLKTIYENFRANIGELTLDDLEELKDSNPEAEAVLKIGREVADKVAKRQYQDSRKFVLLTSLKDKQDQLVLQLAQLTDPNEINETQVQLASISKYINQIKQGKTEA